MKAQSNRLMTFGLFALVKLSGTSLNQDLDDATVRENFFLDGVGLPNAGTKVRL